MAVPPLYNVHQPGLKRGSEKMPFDPTKSYFYVEHPTEGWRVYLRSTCFIHEVGNPNPARFLVVKKTGTRASSHSWEMIKGQSEGKDSLAIKGPLLDILTQNIHREVEEEGKITKFERLRYTGLVFQSTEKDYPPNTYFQYHIFEAFVTPATVQAAFDKFDWLQAHPAAFKRLRRDGREKDALAWFSPQKTKLMGRWAPPLVALYLSQA